MPYTFFLLYTAAFVFAGLLAGALFIRFVARNRIAIRNQLGLFRTPPRQPLLHPVPLDD